VHVYAARASGPWPGPWSDPSLAHAYGPTGGALQAGAGMGHAAGVQGDHGGSVHAHRWASAGGAAGRTPPCSWSAAPQQPHRAPRLQAAQVPRPPERAWKGIGGLGLDCWVNMYIYIYTPYWSHGLNMMTAVDSRARALPGVADGQRTGWLSVAPTRAINFDEWLETPQHPTRLLAPA
jgi:hypothetical protein